MSIDGTEPITNTEDLIDSRDVIARIEYLKAEWNEAVNAFLSPDEEPHDCDSLTLTEDDWSVGLGAEDARELVTLLELQEEAEGYAPDWRYGETLIRDSYFEEYARAFAEDIGLVNSEASWPHNCIDWEQAARELQMDYTSVDFDGVTYWVR